MDDLALVVSRTLVPSHSRIDSEEERTHYWQTLVRLWGATKAPHRHPGCNPASLSRARLSQLARRRYGLTLKSDGVRYALLLTLRPGTTQQHPVALMIDRSRNMYEVEVLAPEAYFVQGTLLEGELVWRQPHEREMLFLIFDALYVRGRSFAREPFEVRLREAERCTRWSEEVQQLPDGEARVLETDSLALVHFDPPLVMRPKRFVDREHAARLWAERNDGEHRVDGLILFDYDAPYRRGTADDGTAYKWKEHSTVDLAGPPDALRMADGPLPSTLVDRRVVVMPSRIVADGPDGLVEYLVSVTADEVRLFPTRTRPDKATANGARVVAATVQDVVDDLRPEELAGSE